MYRSRVVLVLLVISLVAAACGGGDSDTVSSASTADVEEVDQSAEPEPAQEEDEAEDPAGSVAVAEDPAGEAPVDDEPEPSAFPRTITDALGPVEVNEAPMRVVALDQSLIDIAFVLGLEIIGHTTFMDPEGPIPDLYGDAVEELGSASIWVGDLGAPNLELIAATEPDMIITSAVRHEAIADQLSQIAPTVMTESAGAGWKDSLRLIAEATGRESVAQTALTEYEARAVSIGTAINEAHDEPTLSVVRFVDVIRLYQPPSFSGTVLADAGIARPASQQDPDEFISVISEEELPLADADWLVYAIFPNEDVEAAVAERQDSPLWTTLSVVANDRAFPVADDRWMSGVGLFGANAILDDLEEIFGVAG